MNTDSSASDLARIIQEDLTPRTRQLMRPETIRLRSRLDAVMTRLNGKLDKINGDSEDIASKLDPKATRMARKAFTGSELEDSSDDAARH